MKSILKIICLICLTLTSFSLTAQEVDNATFNEAVDYINCKIAELSMVDQIGQPNLADYQTKAFKCDMSQFDGKFYPILNQLLADKKLGKNQQLATFINSFKTKYDNEKSADDLFSLLMEDLMIQQPIEQFKGRHSTNYPSLETEMAKSVYELFGVAARQVQPDDNSVIEQETQTFRDSSQGEDYMHRDGGLANDEIIQEEEEDNPTMPDLAQHQSFFAKYRWYIFGFLVLFALGYFWFTRGANVRMNNPITSNSSQKRASNSELGALQGQIEELQATGLTLQEEVTMLRHRINEFEARIDDDVPYNNPTLDISNKETSFIEDINEDAIHQNIIDDNDEELETGGIPMTKGTAFFMPIPTINGVFTMDEATTIFKRPYSVYIFTITSADGKQAEFKIYEDIATMIRALDKYDEYVRPACRSQAILHKSATKIITEDHGLAIKDGNAWKVVTKAVVRYV